LPYSNHINVYTPEVSTAWPPIGIGYVASYLEKEGHSVIIYDRNAEIVKFKYRMDLVNNKLLELLVEFKPNLVGISSTTPTIKDAFKTAKAIKDFDTNIPVVLGGVHGTALPEESLNKCNSIDIIVVGEGEVTFSEICSTKPLSEVSGIVYRNPKGNILKNPQRLPIESIDSIPYPARHLFDMDFYLQPSTQIIFGYKCKGTSVVSSRGCPNACKFCAGPIISRNKVRYHSAQYTIKELEILLNSYDVEGVFFADEMFTGNRDRVIKLCKYMIEKKISTKLVWGVQIRVDFVDYELLKIMKAAGCVQVEYGFESGSQRILHEMGKNITVEQCIKAAELTHQAGLRLLCNIIVGWPSETLEDLNQTIKLVEDTIPDFVSWHEFRPLPGSNCWKYAKMYDMEDNSFEKNEPFLFCNQERSTMKNQYENQLRMNSNIINTAQGLYSDNN
jgi:radical SAM superfamily enzyme YgiQ (UPF0313 family)